MKCYIGGEIEYLEHDSKLHREYMLYKDAYMSMPNFPDTLSVCTMHIEYL